MKLGQINTPASSLDPGWHLSCLHMTMLLPLNAFPISRYTASWKSLFVSIAPLTRFKEGFCL
jgi:hypothetical protein